MIKTNFIFCYRKRGVDFGELYINGVQKDEKRFKNLSCYIMQEDLLQPLLTLQEQMYIAACLKLPRHYTQKQKLAQVCTLYTIRGGKSNI